MQAQPLSGRLYPPIGPIASRIGSKWRYTQQGKFPEPQYPIIIEPFSGFAGYSQHFHWLEIILADLNPTIVDVLKLIQSLDESDYDRLPGAFIQVPEDLPANVKALVGHWASRGSANPRKTMSSWQEDYPDSFWGEKIKRRLITQAPFMRHWNINHGDYWTMPNIEATWFIDPPYQKKPGIYHPYCGLDYQRLREWVLSRCGQVIVCEGGTADWLDFKPLAPGRTMTGRPSGVVGLDEVWWYRSAL